MKAAFKLLSIHKIKAVLTVIVLISGVYYLINRDTEQTPQINPESIEPAEGFDTHYYHVNRSWDAAEPQGIYLPISADNFSDDSMTVPGYDDPAFRVNRGETVRLTVNVPESGVYHLAFDQRDVGHSILPTRIGVLINGAYPFEEARTIELPTRWVFARETFLEDRYGHEIMPGAIKDNVFEKVYLHDSTALNARPLSFYLSAGENTIDIKLINGDIQMGTFYIESVKNYPTYAEYLAQQDADLISHVSLVIGAEQMAYKTNPSIRLQSERDPSATSYNTQYLRLNAIDGQSFRKGNDVIAYEIDVPETGYYHLGFKYKQDALMQMPVFREIRINGDVPFEEAALVPFNHTNSYKNMLVGNDDDPYMFYFEEGKNLVSLRVIIEPYRNAYENIIMVMNEMTDLSLEIKKLTGNTTDRYRTWRLETYIPDIEDRFDRWIETLEHVEEELSKFSTVTEPTELKNLQLAIKQLTLLREDVNDIPNKMRMLADGDSSTAQLLGASIHNFLQNGLTFEKIYVSGDANLPSPRANVVVRTYESVKRFFLSFTQEAYGTGTADDDEVLEIWVNYPRQYLEIMQQIIDSEFTPETGIRVQLSLMPDENKLILANAAGTAPDIALGVNHWLPYEFAIRNASLDLRQFDGYSDTVSQFAPGVMVPYAFEEGMYGMPLTQNFWVTFYRTDILDSLNIEPADTWDDVVDILPELQRYGMNYYEPLAFFGGFKPFVATMPFIYQFGGELYAEDGMSTVINSEETLEGMQLMTDLFTIYNMPKEVPNFYNHFRYGTMPIGISDLSTYLQLTIAAPEIAGKWDIAPHPGVMNEHGEVERWAASGAQASVILSATEKPDESWAFLQWWMSTPIQTMFANRLQTTFGTEFLWNTANLEAFAQLPLPQDHIDVILEQWEYALEASRIPGAYMVEREISNAWNKIVFNDANPRIALDEAVRIANREILYRMQEFGYVEDGVVVKPYRVPTMRNIDYWLRGHDDD